MQVAIDYEWSSSIKHCWLFLSNSQIYCDLVICSLLGLLLWTIWLANSPNAVVNHRDLTRTFSIEWTAARLKHCWGAQCHFHSLSLTRLLIMPAHYKKQVNPIESTAPREAFDPNPIISPTLLLIWSSCDIVIPNERLRKEQPFTLERFIQGFIEVRNYSLICIAF